VAIVRESRQLKVESQERTAKALPEAGEVEGDRDGLTFGGKDLDGCGIGSEDLGGELKFQGGTHGAAVAKASASVEWVAPGNGRGNDLIAVIHLDSEVFPEIIGARYESGRASGIGYESTIGCSEIDFDGDLDELFFAEMIEPGLLSAVIGDAAIGELSELREWSEKSNGRDVGAGLGRWEKLDVFAQEGCIVALAEEVGFADGGVRERRVEGGSGGKRKANSQEQRAEDAREVAHGKNLKQSIERRGARAYKKKITSEATDKRRGKSQRARVSTERGEIEVDGDGVAFGEIDLDGGGIGSE
jgi:hypothetical protein